MRGDQVKALIAKYNAGTLSPRERALLESWYAEQAGQDYPMDGAELHQRLERIASQLPLQEPSAKPLWVRWVAAAVIVLAVAGYYLLESEDKSHTPQQAVVNDIAPGGNKAVLTLADGTKIDLDKEQDGIVVGNEITYSDGTAILSTEVGKSESQEDSPSGTVKEKLTTPYYVLTTPKGGTYQVVLSDGTKVWLNAGSTLRYPIRFTGDKREVFLEGEGFFKVSRQGSLPARRSSQTASDKEQPAPFIVRTRGQQNTVLGTEFNISAYPDEKEIKTTLASGVVKVTPLQGLSDFLTSELPDSKILKPNEQSILSATGLQTRNVDINSEIAWKNGDFVFRNEDLETALRKVARWYDVEIVYDASAPKNLELGGWVSRSKSLSAVLKVIGEAGDVTFNITERRIMVTK